MYCIHCGAELKEGQKFCKKCGAPVNIQSSGGDKKPAQEMDLSGDSVPAPGGTTQKRNNKKITVAVIAVVACIAVLIIGAVALGTGTAQNTVASTDASATHNVLMKLEDQSAHLLYDIYAFGSDYNTLNIKNITFYDTMDNVPALNSWDVSEAQDGSVKAWVETIDSDYYNLYIAGEGGVYANPDSGYLFYNYQNLESLNFNDCFYTDDVVSMKNMFENCYSLPSLDVSEWNTSNVTDMYSLFNNCNSLVSLDVSKWDTSNVLTMRYMFRGCYVLTSLNIDEWNTSVVTNMEGMFNGCKALTSLDINNWDTSNVTDMMGMFSICESLISLDASSWDTSHVTDMEMMFYKCSSLTSLDVSGWDTSNAGITTQELLDQRYES